MHGLMAGTGTWQAGTWGTAEDGVELGASPPGAPELIPSLLIPLFLSSHAHVSLSDLFAIPCLYQVPGG